MLPCSGAGVSPLFAGAGICRGLVVGRVGVELPPPPGEKSFIVNSAAGGLAMFYVILLNGWDNSGGTDYVVNGRYVFTVGSP